MPIEITKTLLRLEDITTSQFTGLTEGPETIKIRLGNFARIALTYALLQEIKEYLGWIDFRIREERVTSGKYTYHYEYYFYRIE